MKNKLLIIGASGHGKVVADIALRMNKWQNVAFIDDNKNITTSMGLEVIGTSEEVSLHINDCDIFVGIGNNVLRQSVHEKLEASGASIPSLIHPDAIIGSQVNLGIGTVVMARTIINCGSIIGKGCIINTASTIDHDNYIANFVHLSPGVHLAGSVTVGQGSWLGIGSVVSNNVSITGGCTMGAGAVVIKDVTEAGVYVGVPVRRV
ncbi:acetyltransferase [Metabacillus sp. FJAT-52054]|uniref:Acetyltransferase n=1 Tax=Metabacillus sediminis TaxID=3117746 RepID=A0ABZ2NFZ3_9BACI